MQTIPTGKEANAKMQMFKEIVYESNRDRAPH